MAPASECTQTFGPCRIDRTEEQIAMPVKQNWLVGVKHSTPVDRSQVSSAHAAPCICSQLDHHLKEIHTFHRMVLAHREPLMPSLRRRLRSCDSAAAWLPTRIAARFAAGRSHPRDRTSKNESVLHALRRPVY